MGDTADLRFPDPRLAPADGVLLVTAASRLTAANLRAAYRLGIFPWPAREGWPVPWASPDPRAILELDKLRVPKSLRQLQRRAPWKCTIDLAFDQVMEACATSYRPGQPGTWITRAMRSAYGELHRCGWAHSVEVWEGADLVGGLYGVDAGGLFVGESMFFHKSGASKYALLHLIEHLRARGADWIDIQQLTPHMEKLGARAIPRGEFLERLGDALRQGSRLFGA